MEKFGEVLAKEPSCRCFSVKGGTESEEELLSLRIASDESQLQVVSKCCYIWMQDDCLNTGKGQLKFTYSFQDQLRTSNLAIRALKVVPYRDPPEDIRDQNFVCRVYFSQKDVRALHDLNNSFVDRIQTLLVEVERRREFTNERDLIKRKVEEYSLAIYPDEEGFLLFKRHYEYTRPVHVLLRIDPPLMTMELCFPRSRLLLSTLSHERIPVTSLQEAIDEFSRSPSGWPVVRRGEHGGDWSSIHPRLPSREYTEEQDAWNSDDTTAKHTEPFLNDTVRELHRHCSAKRQDCVGDDTTRWEEESVRSLVRQVVHLRWQEHFSFYITVEKATLAILGRFDSTAEVFVDAIAKVIWTSGSDSLCIYKLLVAAVDVPAVKRAVLKKNLLCLLLRQYELMTQIIFSSSSSESYSSSSTFSETRMEIGEMQYFTCPQTGEVGMQQHLPSSPNLPTGDVIWTQTSRTPTSSHQVLHSGSEGTFSTLSLDLIEQPPSYSNLSNVSRASPLPETKERRQDVPKLSFYWLIKHEGTRSSTNTGTTRTTISLPDGRSIVFGDERGGTETQSVPLKGSQPAQHFTLTQGNEGYERLLKSTFLSNSISRTLLAWGMKPEHLAEHGFAHSVAYAIKCTLFEIFCAFSSLNLDEETTAGLEDTKDFQLLFGGNGSPVVGRDDLSEDDVRHPATLAVVELLAPPWQVFPGEQPPIRWGPTPRGSHLALAVLHEFACRPLHEVDTSDKDLLNIRLFVPQDLTGGSYHSLIGGVKSRLAQISANARIGIMTHVEEATSLINLLCDLVGSSPSSSQSPLVAYSCSDAFISMESTVFSSNKVGSWRIPHFRAFHALLRLYRCILERASDVVLIDFLISSLLERISWVKLVRDFSRAVLFSEKLEKKCDPEELACLRLGVWSYHTALVKVMAQNQQQDDSQYTGNIPEDFQDSKPAAFGQDPLDFLDYLFAPESGFAALVLRKKEWGLAQAGPPLGGGLHAQVLLFLKILFSIPNNEFMRQQDISSFYLDLHWASFRKILHLEVIRVIMKHHTLDIFAHVRKLGIMSCLADEIALESSNSAEFSHFNPPPSQLTADALKADIQAGYPVSQGRLSDTEGLDSSGHYSFLSSSAQWLDTSKAFNSVQESIVSGTFCQSTGEVTSNLEILPVADVKVETSKSKLLGRGSRRKKNSSKSSQDSVRKIISKTFSFRSSPRKTRSSPKMSEAPKSLRSMSDVPQDTEQTSGRSFKRRSQRSKTHTSRILSSIEIPSRIPKVRSRRSPRRNSGGRSISEDRVRCRDGSHGVGNSTQEGCGSNAFILSPASANHRRSFPSFKMRRFSETKIPRLPSQESSSTLRQGPSRGSSVEETGDGRKTNSYNVFSNLFQKKKKAIGSARTSVSSDQCPDLNTPQKSKKENCPKSRKTRSETNSSRGIFSKKKLVSGASLSSTFSQSGRKKATFSNEDPKMDKKGTKEKPGAKQQPKFINRTAKPVDGPSRIKIPTSPNRLRLSLGSSSSLTGRDSPLSYGTSTASGGSPAKRKTLNVPVLNLAGIKSTSRGSKKPTVGQTSLNISDISLSRQSNSKTKKINIDKAEGKEKLISGESTPRTQVGKATFSAGRSSKSQSGSRGTHRTDECSDANGPPTFGAYCVARVQERESPLSSRKYDQYGTFSSQSKKPPSGPKALLTRTTKTISSSESQSVSRCFETPSDFECTGNVAEDCKKVELLERAFYGLSSATFSTDSHGLESSVEDEPIDLNMGISDEKRSDKKEKRTQDSSRSPQRLRYSPSYILESRKSIKKESVVDSQGSVRVSIVKSRTSVLETTRHEWSPSSLDKNEKRPMTTLSSEDDRRSKRPDTSISNYAATLQRHSPSYFNVESRLERFSSRNSYKTSSDFDYSGDRDEQREAFDKHGEKSAVPTSPSLSSIGTSGFDSMIDTGDDLVTSVIEKATIVPKLNIADEALKREQVAGLKFPSTLPATPNFQSTKTVSEQRYEENTDSLRKSVTSSHKVPALNLTATKPLSGQDAEKTSSSKTLSPTDELSSFSWLQLSAKDSISESEFARLLNDGAKSWSTTRKENVQLSDHQQQSSHGGESAEDMSLCPCDAIRRERFVYSDLQLRVVFMEILLEGMLLEYNTRAARDRDRRYADVENITKSVPKVLKNHLNHKISESLVKLLSDKVGFQSKNLHRLLRLFCHCFFPADLYKSIDHVGRGAFSHVHRCDLPFEGTPETCAIKIMDHPVGHNEMSSLMDVYSEIYILEQFKDDHNVCSLYDYGVNKDSVFMVMKDYKCSLLDWRKQFPDQSAGALRLFLRIFHDIIEAVRKLHDKNVVHFDLKCSNVLLEPLPGISEEHFWNPPTEEPPFRVVLADFGEARSYNNNWEAKTVRNRGTEYNKSPEMLLIAKAQQIDRPEYDRRKRIGAGPPSDVWALGCLLFELVTGELLQLDTDWSRFFLRVTTNTMSVVDKEKEKMLPLKSRSVIGDLLDYILVRTHLWRPNLNMLSRKLEAVMLSGRLGPYALPRILTKSSETEKPNVERKPRIDWIGNMTLPVDEAIKFSSNIQMAKIECLLNPWFLSDKDMSLLICVKGKEELENVSRLRSTASRASVELLEISVDCNEGIGIGYVDIIVTKLRSRKACFTCESGYEKKALELILKTVQSKEKIGGLESLMEVWRQLKIR